jgi:hypothetical protein
MKSRSHEVGDLFYVKAVPFYGSHYMGSDKMTRYFVVGVFLVPTFHRVIGGFTDHITIDNTIIRAIWLCPLFLWSKWLFQPFE